MSRLVKTGAKFGAVGAVVYYTVEYGVWKDSNRTEQLYRDIYKVVAPLIKENVPIEPPELPKSSEVTHFLKTGWNNGVISATHVITNLPSHSANLYNQISEWITSQVQEDKSSKS